MNSVPSPIFFSYRSYLFKHLRKLSLSKNYLFFSLAYGISTLVIPFSVQLLVNNLALTGLWVSTFSFLLLIGVALAIILVIKYAQLLLVEYMQRNILNVELRSWFDETPTAAYQSPYYFEMFKMLKSFATITSEGVDLFLTCFFGVLALSLIHPAFFIVSMIFIFLNLLIRIQGRGSIDSSIRESNEKYDLFFSMDVKNPSVFSDYTLSYLKARDLHFGFIRRQSITIFFTYFLLQILLLSWGVHLIQINQLSLGQLVSAEIILSGMMANYTTLPKLLEAFYDFETSCFKIDHAKAKGDA